MDPTRMMRIGLAAIAAAFWLAWALSTAGAAETSSWARRTTIITGHTRSAKRGVRRPAPVRKGSSAQQAFEAFEQGRYLTALARARKAAAKGEAAAHALIGEIYARGLGVAQDLPKAAKWYAEGARRGDVGAVFALALLYAEGRGVVRDRKRAADLFEAAAKKGHVLAEYNLALIYVDGKGRSTDIKEAARWLEKAAAQDHARAQYDLGVLYGLGRGVRQDATKAAHWIGRAAAAGLPEAEVDYAVILFKGRGVHKDRRRAGELFRSAALKGNPVAQNRLARLLAYGVVYERNPVEAAKWHLIARAAGVSDMRLDIIIAGLSKQDRSKAERAAAEWREAHFLP